MLAGCAAYVVAGVVLGWVLWPGVADLLPGSPAEFATRFSALVGLGRGLLTGLGTLTAVLILVALVRDGGVTGRRGRLRILGIALLVLAGVVNAVAADPAAQAVEAAARTAAASLPSHIERWNVWRWCTFGLGAVALGALIIAHRSPVVVPAGDIQLSAHHRTLLLLLATATLFEGYDRFILSLALPYIALDFGLLAEGVGKEVAEGELGWAASIIRSGALLAVPLCLLADRSGRRGVLLLTVLAYTVVTGLSGLSRGLVDLIALQVLATMFLTAELALAQVVIAEEFPANARGTGQGLLGAAAAVGAGLAAALFPLLINSSLGWRGLYFIGIVPLLIVGYLRRSLPETRRWTELDPAERRSAGLLRVLVPAHRFRFAVLVVLAAVGTASFASGFFFASYHATTAFQWSPGRVATMVLTGGGLGFWGWMVFGRMADTLGRRPTGMVCVIGAALAVIAYYRTAWLFPSFAAMVFFESGITISVTSLSTECFPTALRATARAWITNAGVVGAMLGFALIGWLSQPLGGAPGVVALLGAVLLCTAPLFLLLPETYGRELEQIED